MLYHVPCALITLTRTSCMVFIVFIFPAVNVYGKIAVQKSWSPQPTCWIKPGFIRTTNTRCTQHQRGYRSPPMYFPPNRLSSRADYNQAYQGETRQVRVGQKQGSVAKLVLCAACVGCPNKDGFYSTSRLCRGTFWYWRGEDRLHIYTRRLDVFDLLCNSKTGSGTLLLLLVLAWKENQYPIPILTWKWSHFLLTILYKAFTLRKVS